jgi:hypothetical protein
MVAVPAADEVNLTIARPFGSNVRLVEAVPF